MKDAEVPVSKSLEAPMDQVAPGIHGLRIGFVSVFGITHADESWTLIDAGAPYSRKPYCEWARTAARSERMPCGAHDWGGADKLCFVIAPDKTDILEYYGSRPWGAEIAFVTQPKPRGLCDALFRAAPFIPAHEAVVIGLPDTIWQPQDAPQKLPGERPAA